MPVGAPSAIATMPFTSTARTPVGELLRRLIRRAILKPVGIEDDNVGDRAVAKDTAVAEAEYGRRKARHRPDRLRQVDDMAVANVDGELPRKGAIAARMRLALARRGQIAVRARHRPRLPHDPHDVVIGHVERHERRVALLAAA